ncbi:MAG: hypothetical protein A2135_05295 [Actinobacteria bacterium RBG_16_67_15]|nr:MAG: hypothetical protein A2135_05295 [Actinobacteria bacterium RBG_16_67_15]
MILLLLAAGELLVATGLARWRRRLVGGVPGRSFGAVAAMTVAALLVGTVLPVSGVVLAVPVIAGIAVVLWRSPWRVGDMAALVLVAGAGTALGYQLAATLDPDTGSYTDQGALWLALAGVPTTLTALASGVWRLRERSAQR